MSQREWRIDTASEFDRWILNALSAVLFVVGVVLLWGTLPLAAAWFGFHWQTIWQVAVLWCLVAMATRR